VVTDRHKLLRVYGPDTDYWELFDLEKDPQELTSVFDRPEYADVRKDLEQQLAALRKDLQVPEQDPPGASGGRPGRARAKAAQGK
jgi:hypothetical protein